jgi:hypothetical protein
MPVRADGSEALDSRPADLTHEGMFLKALRT